MSQENFHRTEFKRNTKGTVEVAVWLEAMTVLPKDLGLIPRTHTVAHNYL